MQLKNVNNSIVWRKLSIPAQFRIAQFYELIAGASGWLDIICMDFRVDICFESGYWHIKPL
jgi:hypothetical protein